MSYHPVMRTPEAVLIDLDDTILDDSGCVEVCWNDAVAEAAVRLSGVSPQDLRAAIDRQASWYWSDAERHRTGRLDLRFCTRSIVTEAFAELGIADTNLAHQTSDLYRDLREERAELFPDAIETLNTFRDAGVRLGLMTNGAGPAQRAKLERFGLTSYFDHVVIEGEFGCGKPDERVFHSLLSALRVAPEKTWAVGDNLEFDVLAPMRLSIHGIWVNRASEQHNGGLPDRIIGSLAELARSE
jgi:putative hydrolase of the HAD superfamily